MASLDPQSAALQAHIRALRDCNQRGGRLLSLLDLVDAGTVSLDLAAYLAAVMRAGSSLLVGARPGGAGKTTVMVALLNFLPDATAIQPIEGRAVLGRALLDTDYGSTCYLAHEIGDGFYYAYVWGEEARLTFELAGRGHIIASNLHADTLEEARVQLCETNGVAPHHFAAVTLKAFLRVTRGPDFRRRRLLSKVYESDGSQERLVWIGEGQGSFRRQGDSHVVTGDQERAWYEFLEVQRARNVRTIEDIRAAVLRSDAGR